MIEVEETCGGGSAVDDVRANFKEVEERLNKLESRPDGTEAFRALVGSLAAAIAEYRDKNVNSIVAVQAERERVRRWLSYWRRCDLDEGSLPSEEVMSIRYGIIASGAPVEEFPHVLAVLEGRDE